MGIPTEQQAQLSINTTMDMYLSLMEDTEPPYLFHRWCFLSIVGTVLGRNVWLPFGEDRFYPNMYVVLIGPPATRKSTAIKRATGLLEASGYHHFVPDNSRKEKFLQDWEHGFDKIYKGVEPGSLEVKDDGLEELFTQDEKREKISEAFIKAGELLDFFSGGAGAFITMLINLWDNLPSYGDRFKNSKSIYVPNPTLSMLGGATSQNFANMFSSEIVGSGLFSRLILVSGKEQRKKILIPPPLNEAKKSEIIMLLQELRHKLKGPMELTSSARELLYAIYQEGGMVHDSRLLTYKGRRLDHLLKVCIIIAASECSMTIDDKIVVLANTVLSFTEMYMPTALGEFGKAKNADVSQMVLDVIAGAEESGGIDAEGIMKLMGSQVDNMNTLGTVLQKLLSSGKIESRKLNAGPRVLVLAKQDYGKGTGVDFDLLWEYQIGEGR